MNDLITSCVVNAHISEVWTAWTTDTGLQSFFSPNARIDLRRGGDFEVLFDLAQPAGQQGSEGCVVVDFEPNRSLAFTWNFPPSLPSIRGQHTIVELEFNPLDGGPGTEVVLRQTGWRSDGEWPDGYAYFERAWGNVLDNLREAFA